MSKEKLYSRKDVLKIAGKSVAGVALATSIPAFLTGCGSTETASVELPSKEVLSYTYVEASEDAAPHPFPYQKLDFTTAVERGRAGYYNKGNCCIGCADAIIGELADVAGYPFNQVPVEMFMNGGTGYGVGTLCGALGGAAGAIGLVCEPEAAKEITQELWKWYTSTELPIYQPDIQLPTTISPTVNCIDSVTTFMEASGYNHRDPERKERCACLTGDVAGKTVELINAYYNL